MAATNFSAADRRGRTAPSMRDALLRNLPPLATEADQPRCSMVDRDLQAVRHASFGALDPDIISESIAAFSIGRNADGLWVACERSGRIGGIFILKSSAVVVAHRHAGDSACATIFPADGFELDIENDGNRLAGLIGPLVRACRQARLHQQRP